MAVKIGIQSGDMQAVRPERGFDHLFEAHQERLRGFIRCRVSNDASADDLVQETWAEVWRRIETFDETKGTFWTFTLIWAKFVLRRYWEHLRSEPQPAFAGGSESPSGSDTERVRDPLAYAERLSSEEALHRSRALLELLRRVLACSRPPHEIIAFGFAKLKWKPTEIAQELSQFTLRDLAMRLEVDYTAVVPSAAARAAFSPLVERLSSPLADLIRDPRTRRTYESLLPRVSGETHLLDYYPDGRSAEEAIVHWWDFVKRAVFTEIRNGAPGQLMDWVVKGYTSP